MTYSRTEFCDVDVCIVMESTYPYLKGGVSAVVHDIISMNPDITFGIIHITWDENSPLKDLYEVPENVKWVKVHFQSFQTNRKALLSLGPRDLPTGSRARRDLANRLLDALAAVQQDDVEPLWSLYDDGVNPRTRKFRIWPLLGTKEFMDVVIDRWNALGMSLSDCFWVLRDFFSLAYAILDHDFPKAKVYHAHTTGYAAATAAAAARQNGTHFLLTEHNLYIRDTVNELLDRNMALPLLREDYKIFEATPKQRAWMTWWIEMGPFCYPKAEIITYLYPLALSEARALGSPTERAIVLPNGMPLAEFEPRYEIRKEITAEIVAHGKQTWKLCSIVRIVPIKGVLDLIHAAKVMIDSGFTNFTLDVMGPKEHVPEYTAECEKLIVDLGLSDYVHLLGTVNVRKLITSYDLLLMASYNEGQPIVVLEAMASGIPTVGTEVGGMRQVLDDVLIDRDGTQLGPCGVLIDAGDIKGMARETISLVNDLPRYGRYVEMAHRRVQSSFRLEDVMARYHALYRAIGRMNDPSDIAQFLTGAVAQSASEANADDWISSSSADEEASRATAIVPRVESARTREDISQGPDGKAARASDESSVPQPGRDAL